MNLKRLVTEYQEHLLKNIFNSDKERFEKAWQQALGEGCEEAISWKNLVTPTPLVEKPLDLASIYRPESMVSVVKQVSFAPFQSFFIWKC